MPGLTHTLPDLHDKVALRVLAAEGKGYSFPRPDGQCGVTSSGSQDVTGLPGQGGGPRLDDQCDAAAWAQCDLRGT